MVNGTLSVRRRKLGRVTRKSCKGIHEAGHVIRHVVRSCADPPNPGY